MHSDIFGEENNFLLCQIQKGFSEFLRAVVYQKTIYDKRLWFVEPSVAFPGQSSSITFVRAYCRGALFRYPSYWEGEDNILEGENNSFGVPRVPKTAWTLGTMYRFVKENITQGGKNKELHQLMQQMIDQSFDKRFTRDRLRDGSNQYYCRNKS